MGFLRFIGKRVRRLVRALRPKPRCNICGGTWFGGGPHGRLSETGRRPCCKACKSLERHRAFHKIMQRLDPAQFKAWSCLQFSRDSTVKPEWFGAFEVSLYGSVNSIDLQDIQRADGSYDVIICNHVLEHVPDHRAALRELARVLSARGFLLLSFPDPYRLERTVDWGHAKEEEFGHYRMFGRDVEAVIAEEMPDCDVVPVVERDDVTGVADMAYVITRNRALRDRAARR